MKELLKYTTVFIIIISGALMSSLFIQKSISKKDDIYALKINEYAENEWYYEVYIASKLIIKQETIPGVSGKQYFRSKEEARKIGVLVINKLKSGIMPMISLNELKRHDITFKK
ncbi:DUF4907 domain-containing protein [uncultured Aquimarina sp.]|uniref:DUF4907 domain-containing protein n=1 Tax=uncultured Aquimarina sp. TaxID=575652 RepID=UPI0026306D0E|nr:DUF4907 domain-containing protein [uncultured Aquimarina sp.]